MTDTTNFDLLTRRKKGWKPQDVLVVSPYVEEEFFRRLGHDLKPKRLHIVIDDGCRRDDRDTVLQALAAGGYKATPAFKLGSARGLVHMKLLYIRWHTPAGRTAHSLIFGSANASRQGFSGRDNAELVADATLTASAHSDIIAWCDEVMAATRQTTPVEIDAVHGTAMSKGLKLRLPAITVGRKKDAVSNFDLWIQRGFLLSAYRPDPSFLRIILPLARALPPGDQARRAEETGFVVARTKSIRHSYIDDSLGALDETEDEGDDLGNWRRKFFTWTQLGGEWCAERCEADHRSEFRRRHHEQREAALDQLQTLTKVAPRRALRDGFLGKVGALWDAFGDEAPLILQGRRVLDKDHYAALFDDRVDHDLRWIEDAEFRERYITGFEIVQVPRFRNDVKGWNAFVESLGRQLALDDQRDRPQSRLLMATRKAIDDTGADGDILSDPGRTIAFLRDMFERPDKDAREAVKTLQGYHLLNSRDG